MTYDPRNPNDRETVTPKRIRPWGRMYVYAYVCIAKENRENTRNNHATTHNSLSKKQGSNPLKIKVERHKDDGGGSDTKEEKMVYGINRTKETGGHKKRHTHTKKERGGDREKTGNPEIYVTQASIENSTQSIGWRWWGA